MTSGRGRLGVLVAVTAWACSGDSFTPAPSGGGGAGGGASGAAGAAGAGTGSNLAAGTGGAAGGGAAGGASGAGAGGSPVGGTGGGGAGGLAGASGAGASAGAGAGAAGKGGFAGAPPGACPVLHVAETGSPTADGCTEATPLRTLGSALAEARKRAQTGKTISEIRVCKGLYQETEALVLDLPIKVRGSYACSASPWSLPPNLDATLASSSIVYSSATGLRITDSSPLGASFEGFFLAPSQPPPTGQPSICVEIAPGASPLIKHDNLCQTSVLASGPVFGAVGILVGVGSNAAIESSIISTALGTAEQASPELISGSIGVLIDDPGVSFSFVGNSVTVKEGTIKASGRPANMGVLLRAGLAGAVLRDNHISAGRGRYLGPNLDDNKLASASLGSGLVIGRAAIAPVASAGVTVVGGSVRGGTGSAPATGTVGFAAGVVTHGIEVGQIGSTPLELRLERVRVYAGDPVAALHPTITARFAASFGLTVTGARVVAESSLVHGGGTLRQTTAPRAVVLYGGASLDAALSTFIGGEVAPQGPLAPNGGNEILTQFAGPGAVARFRRSLLVGSDPRSFAFFGNQTSCAVHGPAAGQDGYLIDTADTVYVHYESATPPAGDPHPIPFLGGDAGCPVIKSWSDAKPAETASHFAGNLTVIGRVAAGGNGLAIPGCADATACTKVLFPGYAGNDPAEIVTPLDPSFRPACTNGFPPPLLGPKGTAAETLDDLAGVSRKTASFVGVGAFVPTCK